MTNTFIDVKQNNIRATNNRFYEKLLSLLNLYQLIVHCFDDRERQSLVHAGLISREINFGIFFENS